jgi:hypothetical protein
MEASINIGSAVQRSFSSGAGEAVRWMSGVALIICDTLSDWLERNGRGQKPRHSFTCN